MDDTDTIYRYLHYIQVLCEVNLEKKSSVFQVLQKKFKTSE